MMFFFSVITFSSRSAPILTYYGTSKKNIAPDDLKFSHIVSEGYWFLIVFERITELLNVMNFSSTAVIVS